LEKACSVKAIELDDKLAQDLRERFEGQFKLEVVTADARHIPLQRIAGEFDSYKVVANLPYYAASPIIRRFLEAENKPTAMVVLVQKEVAQNMAALPGKMGLLSVATQLYGNPQIVAVIPPSAFKPSPKVTSALVRIDLYPTPLLRLASADSFFELVRAGFSSPRKQIHNGLGHALPLSPKSVISLLKSVHIDIARRPGTLTLEEWGCLHRAWRSLESTPSG
jgi:16S rRNA (adenine1518-N6/adenine1519-N6)-dimethyltransferase